MKQLRTADLGYIYLVSFFLFLFASDLNDWKKGIFLLRIVCLIVFLILSVTRPIVKNRKIFPCFKERKIENVESVGRQNYSDRRYVGLGEYRIPRETFLFFSFSHFFFFFFVFFFCFFFEFFSVSISRKKKSIYRIYICVLFLASRIKITCRQVSEDLYRKLWSHPSESPCLLPLERMQIHLHRAACATTKIATY